MTDIIGASKQCPLQRGFHYIEIPPKLDYFASKLAPYNTLCQDVIVIMLQCEVIILGDSLLNGINKKGLSKKHNLKIVNRAGATTERLLLEDLDNLIKYQLESVIIHAGTNDLTNGINMLNNAEKIVKELTTKLPKVKITFSGLITRKDRKNLDKNVTEANKKLRNYCRQKDIDYTDNNNITEDSFGIKKLHLNRKGNSFFAKNLLKYLNNV